MDSNHVEHSPGGETVIHPPNRLLQLVWALVWIGVGLYALIFIYHGAALVAHPYDIDNSEGFLLYQSVRIANGQFLYPSLDQAPYLVDNYPPVYPWLGSFFVGNVPNLVGLRAISFVSTLLTAFFLGVWTHCRTKSVPASVLSGLVFLSFYHVYQWGALARVDALGLLFSVAALLVFERWKNWGYALPLLLLALFTKQSLFAAPAAILLVLIANNWRRALKYMTVLLFVSVVFWEFILFITNNEAWNHLIAYNANAFFWSDVWINVRHWVWMYTVWGCAPLAMVLIDAKRARTKQDGETLLLFWFTLGALGEALLCGKIGSAPNYFLSLVAAASVGCGAIYHHMQSNLRDASSNQASQLTSAFLAAAFLFQIIATLHWPASQYDFAKTPTRADLQAGRLIEKRIQQIKGPVLSDLCALPLRAGKPPVFQPFINTQLSNEGKWSQSRFIETVNNRMHPALLLRFDLSRPDWDRRRFTNEMIAAFRTTYELDQQIGEYYLYTLKS